MKKRLTISILFFFVYTSVFSQEKLYGKGSLFVTWDAGLSYNKVRNERYGYFAKEQKLAPSFGFSADYKFLKSPFGIQGGLFFDKYEFRDISVRYITLPLQANVRFGKQTQVKISGGISQSFLVNSKIASSLPIAEEFEASSSKYLVGLVANVEVLHYIKKSKHGVGLGLGAKKIFTDSFSYSFPEKMGTSKQKLYLSGYNFYIQYRLKIF